MGLVLKTAAPLSTAEFAVLMVLGSYADDAGENCFPSQATIAREARLTDRAVRSMVGRLVADGLLALDEAPSYRRSTRYRLNVSALKRGERGSGLSPEPDSGLTAERGSGLRAERRSGHRAERGSGPERDAGQSGTSFRSGRNVVPVSPEPRSADPSVIRQRSLVHTPPRARVAADGSAPEGFEAFWARYPKREGRDRAIRVWRGLNPDQALQERIHEALAWQVQQPRWREQDGRFAPAPADYLADRRWTDERARVGEALARQARIDPAVQALCDAAGIRRYDIGQFFGTAALHVDGAGLALRIAEADVRTYVERAYGPALEDAARRRGGQSFRITGTAA